MAFNIVHCRTGSLENIESWTSEYEEVHCRTGSLENFKRWDNKTDIVYCRTGSLEVRKDECIWNINQIFSQEFYPE